MAEDFDPSRLHDEEHDRDPVPVWRELRHDHPVLHDPIDRVFVLSRFEDVRRAFTDTDNFSSRLYRKTMGRVFGPMLLQWDGFEHVQRRKIVAPLLVGSRLEAYGASIEAVAHEIVEAAAQHAPRFDLVEHISHRLPGTMIATLLGLPREDYDRFFAWYEAMMAGVWIDNEARRKGREAADELKAYVTPLIDHRRDHPGDDLISRLVTSEVDGDRLDPEELGAYIALLLTAGGETTDKSIASIWHLLLGHPEVLVETRADRDVLHDVFTETMRLLPPLIYVAREVIEPVEIHGVEIPVGAEVRLAIGSANRDESVFADPDAFDPHRTDLQVEHRSAPSADGRTAHLAFGAGPHFCVGYQLARKETVTVTNVLLDRFEHISAAEPSVVRVDGPTRSAPRVLVDVGP
jgi:cytochrome P450